MEVEEAIWNSLIGIFIHSCVIQYVGAKTTKPITSGPPELYCCDVTYELTRKHEDSDINLPCTNHANTCGEAGCEENQCITKEEGEEDSHAENKCDSSLDCYSEKGMVKPMCRILYYEYTHASGNKERGYQVEQPKYFVQKECYENADGDVKAGCDFYRKPFYLNEIERITHMKECFCDANKCNFNISYACFNHKHDPNDTTTGFCFPSKSNPATKPLYYFTIFLSYALAAAAYL